MIRRIRPISRSRKPSPKIDESAQSVLDIESVAPSYSFEAGSSFRTIVFEEYLSNNTFKTCFSPEKDRGRVTILTFLASGNFERMMMEQTSAYKTAKIGSLTLLSRASEHLGSLLIHSSLHLQARLTANKFRYIWLTGATASHGSATISSISCFDADIENADFQPRG